MKQKIKPSSIEKNWGNKLNKNGVLSGKPVNSKELIKDVKRINNLMTNKEHCKNCWVEEDGFGSCNLPDCSCHKSKEPKVCEECQFENGKHSLICSWYREPQNPSIKTEEPKDWKKKFAEEWDFIGEILTRDSFEFEVKIKSFICNLLSEVRKESYNEGYEKGKNENLMAIDARVAMNFNKELKDEGSELVKIIKETERKEVVNEVLEWLNGKPKTDEYNELYLRIDLERYLNPN